MSKQLTPEQNKAVEEAAKYHVLLLGNHKSKEIAEYAFSKGMEEVLSNPEKYGLQPKTEWVSVEDMLPLTWESGHWDGRRSDEVLIRKTNNIYTIGRLYHGVMDGHVFTDWNEGKEEWLIDSKEVTHWQPLPQPPTETK